METQAITHDSHVWDYRRLSAVVTCEHDIELGCSTCDAVEDSPLDDVIEPGRVISRVHPQVAGHDPTLPQHRLYMRSWINGVERVTVIPATLPTDTPIPATHEPVYARPWWRGFSSYGFDLEVVPQADSQEVRVREAVRDFGLLVNRRDVEYATSIGLDWDGFVTGIVAPETDHLAVEGAGLYARTYDDAFFDKRLPIRKPSSRAKRPHDFAGIRDWRVGR